MRTIITLLRFYGKIPVLWFFGVVFACNKPDKENTNGKCADNPLAGLPWLKNLINNDNGSYIIYENAFVYSYTFKGRQVIYLWNSASSDSREVVFNCDGTELIPFNSTDDSWEEFENKRTNEVLLWQKTPDPDANICGVKNPLTGLPWLRNLINGNGAYRFHRGALIYSYHYKGEQVIYVWNRAASYSPEVVFNCDGAELIPYPSWPELEEFKNERTDEILLWEKE